MLEKPGLYGRNSTDEEELQRLQKFDYPDAATIKTLLEISSFKKKVFADIGAGPNPTLGTFISERGGKYIPVDINTQSLKNLRDRLETEEIQFMGIQADNRELALANKSIDVSHQRFVLMHLDEDGREKSVKEILRITKDRAYFMEYNWNTLKSSTGNNLLKRFIKTSKTFAGKTGVDLNMGSKLEELLSRIVPKSKVNIFHDQREEGDYTDELLGLCKVSASISRQRLHAEELGEEFEDLRKELEDSRVRFIPPEIVIASVNMQ
ncbi:MAG: class I SAM-dependent methyltransferase [Ignavibacteriaceae bacterium]|nr:class I SAM-dependent methyltransferase [Ignavibacteriaceae bacterium]